MKLTTNYNLKKPEGTDVVNIEDFNDNFDTLDIEVGKKADKTQVLTNVPANAKFTDTVYTHPATHPPSVIAQDANNRFMTDAERTKLTGVATGANNYVHPTGAGNNHIPTGGTVGQILKNTSSGTASWQAENVTTIVNNVTSTSTTSALSANQGRLLDGKITTANQQLSEIATELATHEADNASAHGIDLKANKSKGEWINATLQNGWQGTVRYRKNDLGIVDIDFNAYGGTITKGTVICNLPTGYRPYRNFISALRSDSGIIVSDGSYISVIGEIRLGADLQAGVYYLSAFSFSI